MDNECYRGEKSVNAKKTILILYSHYLPGIRAGGPVQSIAGLIEGLKDEFDFKLICGDRDLGDREPFATEPIGIWYEFGGAKVLRVPPGLAGAMMMIQALHLESYDVLYINGFWPRIFSMLPVACWKMRLLPRRPVVLAPRGEFSQGSLSIKNKRKLLYLRLSALFGLYRGIIWHASTELEEADIRRSVGKLRLIDEASLLFSNSESGGAIVVAKNMHLMQERNGGRQLPKRAGKLRCVFVSRISKEKNLLSAISLLDGLTGDVSFDICGPVGNAPYWNKCKEAIGTLAPNVRVEYIGTIEHERVGEVFSEHDLFLLPTLGENYGHVICEALIAGCPVLISDQTPWRNLQQKGAGWDIPLAEVERFRAVLQQCVDADGDWYAELRARAAEYGRIAASDPAIIEANRMMFRYATSARLEA